MTVSTTIDAGAGSELGKYLEDADGGTDPARAMLQAFAEGAHERTGFHAVQRCIRRADRRAGNSRNGYRPPPGTPGRARTRGSPSRSYAGHLLLGVLVLTAPPRQRAEQALVAVICQAYVAGVSTRRVDDLVKAMGIEGMSKSEVSGLAAETAWVVGLDGTVVPVDLATGQVDASIGVNGRPSPIAVPPPSRSRTSPPAAKRRRARGWAEAHPLASSFENNAMYETRSAADRAVR